MRTLFPTQLFFSIGLVLVSAFVALHAARAADEAGEKPKPAAPPAQAPSRTFTFHYAATLTGLKPGAPVRIWLPQPVTTPEQDVALASQKLPMEPRLGEESKYGNRMLYCESKGPASGEIPLAIAYRVTRRELRGLASAMATKQLSKKDREFYLKPDKLVPISGRPLELLQGVDLEKEPLKLARQLYDRVNDHTKYSKEGTGWGQGDVNWVCDSRYGNCTDFHSLFITFARAKGLPAKFEMGFPIPTERGAGKVGGYHCWAKFFVDNHGWVPVDISEADKNPEMTDYYFGNLTADRVAFSTGRDLTLIPKQAGPPLNFFIYPYVEVDGETLPKDQIKLDFRYEDQK